MNPFKQTLSRTGYLIWSLIFVLITYFILIARQEGWINIGEGSGFIGETVAYLLFGLILGLGLLATARRLQDAKRPIWLAVLVFVPVVGILMWLTLLLLPPRE
jgi:uncharacterized membrane protein YhaH (DUF805 family)